MIITEETIEQLKAPNGCFKMHVIRKMRKWSGFRKWRTRIIGVEIPDDVVNALIEYAKTDDFSAPNKDLKQRTKLPSEKPKTSSTTNKQKEKPKISINADTSSFIRNYIENMYTGNLYGGVVPEWIHSDIQWDIVRIRLMKLQYKAFLRTYYWRAIAMYLKHKNGDHCTYCPAETGLQVHHKTYDHHGIELFYMDELEVVCDRCHKLKH